MAETYGSFYEGELVREWDIPSHRCIRVSVWNKKLANALWLASVLRNLCKMREGNCSLLEQLFVLELLLSYW